jgi:UDP-N-acetylmuramoylalanine--D-glutamate ligase
MRELIHSGQLHGHTATVVGAGRSGVAAANMLAAMSARVRLLEKKEEVAARAAEMGLDSRVTVVAGDHEKHFFDEADLVVLSPGIPPRALAPFLADVPEGKVISELELGFWFADAPIIAVTGSNGKTTTVSVLGEMLAAGGKRPFVGGNIGTPLTEYLLSNLRADVLVLEVSSFQLMHVRSFRPRVGVLLNISDNHLDYHADMAEYFEAKMRLFARQDETDLAILPMELKELLEEREDIRARRVYFVPAGRFEAPHLPCRHNQANLEAAYLAAREFGVSEEDCQKGVSAYDPLPHRMQVVGQAGGVTFVNDSKATTIGAVAAALDCFEAPIRLLMGGKFKGGDLTALLPLMGRVRSVGLYGASREVFESAFAGRVPTFHEETLEQAMRRHVAEAEAGDIILLSPATASYDQYPNYEARGEDFIRIVRALQAQRGEGA